MWNDRQKIIAYKFQSELDSVLIASLKYILLVMIASNIQVSLELLLVLLNLLLQWLPCRKADLNLFLLSINYYM